MTGSTRPDRRLVRLIMVIARSLRISHGPLAYPSMVAAQARVLRSSVFAERAFTETAFTEPAFTEAAFTEPAFTEPAFT